MAHRDPSTTSNYHEWRTRHITADLRVDFQHKRLRGSVELELESLTDGQSDGIVLDSSHVEVGAVRIAAAPAEWQLQDAVGPYGTPLRVAVPRGGVPRGERIRLSMDVATTDGCTALQWLDPAQTSTKRHPYVFSQCQAIHARSIFPCQDTPDVKATISFRITSPLPVIASGLAEGDGPEDAKGGDADAGDKVYRFEQKVPIPAYLFALAAGDIATARIGPRSLVATGPDCLKAAQWEFEADMERYMEVAEKLVFPYRWGQYNVLVLPPSFPYGGERRSRGSDGAVEEDGPHWRVMMLTGGICPQAWRTRCIHLRRRRSSAATARTWT
jgi:leukotriene-A4 hydrolase